jgi:hypothetical protein
VPVGSTGEAEAAPLMIAITTINARAKIVVENANRCLLDVLELCDVGCNV